MEWSQQELELPSTRFELRIVPHEGGYEWSLREYDVGRRRWAVIDSGSNNVLAAVVSDAAMAVSVLAEGLF